MDTVPVTMGICGRGSGNGCGILDSGPAPVAPADVARAPPAELVITPGVPVPGGATFDAIGGAAQMPPDMRRQSTYLLGSSFRIN